MWMRNVMSRALIKGAFALCLLFMNSPLLMAQEEGIKNIVLVHGAFADGSCWSAVISLLQERGYHVSAVQNPLTSLRDDVTATERVLERQKGNVLLVGHSWAGAVITQAGNASNVRGLVYLSALVPDSNQSVSDALARFHAPMTGMEADKNGLIWLDEPEFFHQVMANELSIKKSRQLAAVQQAFDAAQERYRLGSAPITDTHEAQARLAALQAQQWAAQAQLDIQRRALADSTGLAPAQLHAHLPQASQAAPGTDTNHTPASLLLWQERAAQSNPGLLLQQRAVELAQAEADKHQRSSAASVDLVAQAGQERLHGSGSYGDAQNKQLNAMVGLQLTVPLSTGGWRSAKLEDSLRQHEAAQATLEQQREQVAQQVHSAWLGLHLGGERVRALHTALTASSARLDATRTGHEVGDRSLLDVLNAHADQATQQLALAQARSELLLNQLRLAQLAGSLDEDALRQANHSLQATDFATK